MADQKISLKNKIMNIRHLYAYLLAFISSVLTFLFFYFSNEIIREEKIVKKEIDIYEVAKEEAIKLGRMEPDEKPIEIIQEQDDAIPHIDLKGQEKTEDKEIVPDNNEFSLDEVAIDMAVEPKPIKLFEQESLTTTVEDALKMPETESVETPISERIKPDLTEVIEPVRKVPVADMSKLAPEVEVGEFESGYRPKAIKKSQERILKDAYEQNEEQDDNTLWQKTKSDTVDLESPIAKEKFTKYRTRITTDTDYHSRMEQRISDLITNLENGDVKLEDLSNEDQKVIIDILNQ